MPSGTALWDPAECAAVLRTWLALGWLEVTRPALDDHTALPRSEAAALL